jgi:DNA-directed RNA polymerase subunit RPC12/RpoP
MMDVVREPVRALRPVRCEVCGARLLDSDAEVNRRATPDAARIEIRCWRCKRLVRLWLEAGENWPKRV